MLSSLSISNFKAFGKEQSIEFGNLTLFSGLNSSGKSSVYHALTILTHSSDVDSRISTAAGEIPILVLNSRTLTVGKIDEVSFDINNPEISFGLCFGSEKKFNISYKRKKSEHSSAEVFMLSRTTVTETDQGAEPLASFSAELDPNGTWNISAYASLSLVDYKINRELERQIKTGLEFNSEDATSFYNVSVAFSAVEDITGYEHQIYQFSIKTEDILECLQEKYRKHVDIKELKRFLKKNDLNTEKVMIANALYNPFTFLSKEKVIFLAPFRGFPQRVYTQDSSPNPVIGFLSTDKKERPYRYDFDRKTKVRGNIVTALKYWICDFFALAEDLDVKEFLPGYSSEILLKMHGKWIPINNVGFGISQILPVIFEVLTSRNKMMVIDEPEIHLHPSLQSKLADFFFQMAAIGKKIVLETHSDHLINKLIYLFIMYPDFSAKTKLYWTDMSESGSILSKIEFDKLGYILNAPKGFIDEQRNTTDLFTTLRLDKIDEK